MNRAIHWREVNGSPHKAQDMVQLRETDVLGLPSADALNSRGGYLGTRSELPHGRLVILHLLDHERREVELALLLVDAPADRRVLRAIQGANVALWFVHHSNTP